MSTENQTMPPEHTPFQGAAPVIETRVGLIVEGDNRFMGASVFHALHLTHLSPLDTLLAAFGVPQLSDLDREALRLASLVLISPDARVWPLKLCRLLSSYGSPLVGTFAAQLVLKTQMLGPITIGAAAAGLIAFRARIQAGMPARESLTVWKTACNGRIPGFGVPFRAQDERLVALRGFVGPAGLASRPFWQTNEQLFALTEDGPEVPNIALGLAGLLLDVGISPENTGLVAAQLMAPVYVAHALEASQTDRHILPHLPPSAVNYRGIPPRNLGEAPGAEVPAGLRRKGSGQTASSQGRETYADMAHRSR